MVTSQQNGNSEKTGNSEPRRKKNLLCSIQRNIRLTVERKGVGEEESWSEVLQRSKLLGITLVECDPILVT